MKRLLLTIVFMNICFFLFAQKAKEEAFVFSYFKDNGEDGLHLAYSYDGLKWETLNQDQSFLKPELSKDKLMRDPCIIRGGDGLFHMVWTVSWNDKGVGYASSKDLIHWSAQQYLPVMQQEPNARNCWAPEITYDAYTKIYMIYWATTITGAFKETTSSLENQYNHRQYYSTTKDFKTFTPTQLLYDPGFNVIDATIVKSDSQFIMFFKDETREPAEKNIKMAFSKNMTGPYSKASDPITGNYWAEGPTTLRVNGDWIVYFDKYTQHQYGAIRSNDLQSWKDISDQISLPVGIRHGSILRVSKNELNTLLKFSSSH